MQIVYRSVQIISFFVFHIVSNFALRPARFARAGEFKAKMHGFVTDFEKYQSKIEFVLIVQMAGNQGKMSEDLREIQNSISTLIGHIGLAVDKDEREALDYIKEHGLQILEVNTLHCTNAKDGDLSLARQTTEGQTKIGKLLKQPITSSAVQGMTVNFDDLLEKNRFALPPKFATCSKYLTCLQRSI
jgi:hypothetical protein